MNPHSPYVPIRYTWLLTGMLWVFSGTVTGRECWVDIYDKDNFQGMRQHVEGSVELPSLKGLGGQDWGNRIESLKVGADAEVTAFRQENFREEPKGPINHPEAFESWGKQEIPAYQELEISFGAGKQEHHLGELDFHRNINSLKIRCKK